MNFANRIGISPGIVVVRLQKEEFIPFSYLNDMKRRLTWADTGEAS
ncbi:MAG: hypothetical protein U9Q82_11700 [Chloroflexota bacterium]|nr:hypothetical protein [Chloroflexota bacterium]